MEFKRLSDVEVVAEPAESANVLVEENGVIKKAPKTAVGGAGTVEPYLVITINGRSYNEVATEEISVTEGSVENVREALRAGRYPYVKVRFNYADSHYTIKEEYVAQTGMYDNYTYVKFHALDPGASTGHHSMIRITFRDNENRGANRIVL